MLFVVSVIKLLVTHVELLQRSCPPPLVFFSGGVKAVSPKRLVTSCHLIILRCITRLNTESA